jgi:hypothetical protein
MPGAYAHITLVNELKDGYRGQTTFSKPRRAYYRARKRLGTRGIVCYPTRHIIMFDPRETRHAATRAFVPARGALAHYPTR